MLLPMTAVGPLKVETKPILTDFCWAAAGATASIKAAPAASKAVRIFSSQKGRSGRPHILPAAQSTGAVKNVHPRADAAFELYFSPPPASLCRGAVFPVCAACAKRH